MKRFTQFANSSHLVEDTERLFTLIALNCALRNGDAHLKNFGIVYDDVQGEARLAPVYDLVTTSVYLPKDSMALTLNGSTRWPSAKELKRLGEIRMGGAPARVSAILELVADSMSEIASVMARYIKSHPEFAEIGSSMKTEWNVGMKSSLKTSI
jgi:serine/threonine-protein kinase HipA